MLHYSNEMQAAKKYMLFQLVEICLKLGKEAQSLFFSFRVPIFYSKSLKICLYDEEKGSKRYRTTI